MTIIEYRMTDYDFLLEMTRLCAGPAARHIAICRLGNTEYVKDLYVFTAPLPRHLTRHIESKCPMRPDSPWRPRREFQCARPGVVLGPDVILMWETKHTRRPAWYRIDFDQFLFLCSQVQP